MPCRGLLANASGLLRKPQQGIIKTKKIEEMELINNTFFILRFKIKKSLHRYRKSKEELSGITISIKFLLSKLRSLSFCYYDVISSSGCFMIIDYYTFSITFFKHFFLFIACYGVVGIWRKQAKCIE